MRIGIIDLGTNSVRFDIYDINIKKSQHDRLYREKIMIKLGQAIFHNGSLNTDAKKRTLSAFSRFAKIAKHFKTQKIVAFATSALREAKNPDSFLDDIRSKTGIRIEIISGKREAELIARGILKFISPPKGVYGLIDIGGGSTEISICRGKKILFSESFPVGTARIQQLHLKKIPPTQTGVQQARLSIQKAIQRGLENAHPKTKIKFVPLFFGSSGTVKALDRMMRNRFSKKNIDIFQLNKLVHEMEPMDFQELTEIPCMEIKRIDQMVSGSIILQEFMWAFNVRMVKFTEYCLRDGIFDEQLEKASHHPSNSDKKSLAIQTFLTTSMEFGESKSHQKFLLELSESLFKTTQRVHGLPREFLFYLQTALLFRNIGELINYNDHGKHSSYIIENIHLVGLEKWETLLISFLVRFHDEKFNQWGDIQKFLREKKLNPHFNNSQVLKLFALLHTINSLDLKKMGQKVLFKFALNRNKIVIECSSSEKNHLDLAIFDQSVLFVERILKKQLALKS